MYVVGRANSGPAGVECSTVPDYLSVDEVLKVLAHLNFEPIESPLAHCVHTNAVSLSEQGSTAWH